MGQYTGSGGEPAGTRRDAIWHFREGERLLESVKGSDIQAEAMTAVAGMAAAHFAAAQAWTAMEQAGYIRYPA